MIAERVGEGILAVAEEQERQLDEKLRQLETMDEDDFEALRQKRRQEMQKKMSQEQAWRQLGHGRYAEMTDTKDFFNAAKKSERMVVHFYRGVTPRCEIIDAHLQRLAEKHVETRFVKVNAEKNPFLVERLHIIMLPTLVLCKDGKTQHSIIGFDEFGGTDDFDTEDVAYILAQHGVLHYDGDRSEEIRRNASGAGRNRMRMTTGTNQFVGEDDDDFSDEE